MTRASEFNKKTKLEAFKRCQGRCEMCEANLKVGEGEYDHIIPLALTGTSTIENCQVLCKPCHRGIGAKTASDMKIISKAKRVSNKANGIRTKSALSSPKLPKPPLTKTLPPRRLFEERT